MLRHSLSTREKIEDYLGTGHDVFKIDIDISTSTRYYLYIVKDYGIYNTMIREKKQSKYEMIDLTGPQGNAFYLMKRAIELSKQLGLDSDSIIQDMKSGDYDNLIQVFDKHFGSFVVLER